MQPPNAPNSAKDLLLLEANIMHLLKPHIGIAHQTAGRIGLIPPTPNRERGFPWWKVDAS